jgi:hypothetical protein
LTLAILGAIFLGGVLVILWLRPPVIEIRLPPFAPVVHVHVGGLVPSDMKFTLIHESPSAPEKMKGFDEPIPVEILEYCDQESDEWARTARRRRARMLRGELGSWDLAFSQLQQEDHIE